MTFGHMSHHHNVINHSLQKFWKIKIRRKTDIQYPHLFFFLLYSCFVALFGFMLLLFFLCMFSFGCFVYFFVLPFFWRAVVFSFVSVLLFISFVLHFGAAKGEWENIQNNMKNTNMLKLFEAITKSLLGFMVVVLFRD